MRRSWIRLRLSTLTFADLFSPWRPGEESFPAFISDSEDCRFHVTIAEVEGFSDRRRKNFMPYSVTKFRWKC